MSEQGQQCQLLAGPSAAFAQLLLALLAFSSLLYKRCLVLAVLLNEILE